MSMIGLIPAMVAVFVSMLLPLALLVALQIWLCKKGPRLGLVLPGLSLLLSLLLALVLLVNMAYTAGGSTLVSYVDEATGETVVVEETDIVPERQEVPPRALAMVAVVFVIGNLPTAIFLGIWLHYRKKRLWQDDLKKMRIEDLG